jgi:hypothetical protein
MSNPATARKNNPKNMTTIYYFPIISLSVELEYFDVIP